MSIEEKIKKLNIKLPDPKDPVGAYVASKIVGNLLYISGQISINDIPITNVGSDTPSNETAKTKSLKKPFLFIPV